MSDSIEPIVTYEVQVPLGPGWVMITEGTLEHCREYLRDGGFKRARIAMITTITEVVA